MNNEINNIPEIVSVSNVRNRQFNAEKVKSVTEAESLRKAAEVSDKERVDEKKKAIEEDSNDISLDEAKIAAEQGNSILQAVNQNLQFQVDDSTEKVVIKVVERESGDLVRQIPSEDLLHFIKTMDEMNGEQGSFIRDKV